MTPSSPANIEHELAVLFADVCGSTRLYEVLGDAAALAAINACLAVVRRVTQAHGGRVVKTIGDEVMAVFADPVGAANAACEMQSQVDALQAGAAMPLEISIGFNFGPVLERAADGDIFGDTVNVAARMASLARAGQIIAPEPAVARLPAILRSGTRRLEAVSVRGKAADISLVEVLWREGEDAHLVANRTYVPATAQATLRLTCAGRVLVLDAGRAEATLGRDERADLTVAIPTASRLHARIERRRDRFVYIDQSTNGSYVTIAGEAEIRLLREELVLRGSGSISLGQVRSKDPAHAVEFVCQP